jgi:uncharacterized protein YecE (DUF72 family)
VGTSGSSHPALAVQWYPNGLPARDRPAWYAERFDGVEIDSTFYAWLMFGNGSHALAARRRCGRS